MSDKYDGKEDVETTNQNGEDIVIENVPYIIDDEGDKLFNINDTIICGYEQYGGDFRKKSIMSWLKPKKI